MRQLAEQAKQGNFSAGELKEENSKLNGLAAQGRGIDSESRRTEEWKILE